MLVPAGAALLSSTNFDELYWPTFFKDNFQINFAFLFGCIFVFAPIITIFITWILNKCGFVTIDGNLLESESDETYSQNITKDDERTSIEFEKYFQMILKESVGNNKKFQSAVIVIDNLDRVEPHQTLSIWSILQTFFQYRRSHTFGDQQWMSNLWFLIPYDKDGLVRIWQTIDENSNQESESISASFFDKCFQVVAEVPEPVMSSWASFLELQINESLTGWTENERKEVMETYKRFEARMLFSPKPRQIKIFINRIGMLGMRWGGVMTPEAMALYASLRTIYSETELRAELLKSGLPGNYRPYNTDINIKAQLAGMLFGVEEDKGIEILLEPDIYSFLTSGDAEKLQSLISIHGEAFWLVWNSCSDKLMPTNDHSHDYLVSVTQSFCVASSSHKSKARISASQLLDTWKASVKSWDFSKYDYSIPLASLNELVLDKKEFLSWLIDSSNDSLKKIIESCQEEEFDALSIQNLNNMVELIKVSGGEFKQKRYANLKDSKWNEWLDHLENIDLYVDYVKPPYGTISKFANNIDINTPNTQIISYLNRSLNIVDTITEWKEVVEKLCQWISNPNKRQGDNDSIFKLILRLYLKDNNQEKFSILLKSQEFNSTISNETHENSPHLVVLLTIIYENKIMTSDIPVKVNAFFKTEYEEDGFINVISIFEQYKLLPMLWNLARDENNIFAISYIRMIDSDALYSSIDGARYIDEYDWVTNNDSERIITLLEKNNCLKKAEEYYSEDPVSCRNCLRIIRDYGEADSQIIVDNVLKQVDSEQWVKALSEDSVLFDCLRAKGNHKFTEGFLKFALQELSDGNITDHVWDNLQNYYEKIMDLGDIKEKLAKAYFLSENDSFTDNQFSIFNGTLKEYFDYWSLDELQNTLQKWLDNDYWERIDWLLQQQLNVDTDPKESLISRIQEKYENNTDEEKIKTIKQLAGVFNIQLAIEKKEENKKN